MTEEGSLLHKALEAEDSQFYIYDSTKRLGHPESAFFNQMSWNLVCKHMVASSKDNINANSWLIG